MQHLPITVTNSLCPRKLEAKITIRHGDEIKAQAVFDAATLEALITNLGHSRAAMVEQVPETLEPGSRISGIDFPTWKITGNTDTAHLLVRHPGYGWIGIVLSKKEAKKMGEMLLSSSV